MIDVKTLKDAVKLIVLDFDFEFYLDIISYEGKWTDDRGYWS